MDCGDGVTVHIFSGSDCEYSENSLNLANINLPSLPLKIDKGSNCVPENVASNVGENMDYVEPTGNVQVTLLHPRSCEMLEEMQNSIHSVTSSINSGGDIGTLNTIDSNYSIHSTFEKKESNLENGISDVGMLRLLSPEPLVSVLKSSVESPEQNLESKLENSVTDSQKQPQAGPVIQPQHRESISCGIEESTEVLLVNSTECDDKYFGGGRAYSGTDSDVEVLMSEEIVESDWSAGDTATEDLGPTPDELVGAVMATKLPQIGLGTNEHCLQNSKATSSSALVKEESTDQEISVEDFSRSSNSDNAKSGKDTLLKTINEQAIYIKKLESIINRYRRKHHTLFKQVEALRLTLDVNDVDDD